ncbi:MAG: hypothetical protein ABIX28_14455 [Vicinamibacterales bacterium]
MIRVIPAFFALVVAGGLVAAPAWQAADAGGTWDVVFNAPDGEHKGKLILKRDGDALTGAVIGDAGQYKAEGEQKGSEVALKFSYSAESPIPITMKGTVKGDAMSGTATFGSDPGSWSATRAPGGAAPTGGAAQAAAIDISGAWLFEVTSAAGSGNPSVTFNQSGETLTGQYSGQLGEAPLRGTLKGSELSFSFDAAIQEAKVHVVYTGTATKDALKGTVTLGELGEGTFTARRK